MMVNLMVNQFAFFAPNPSIAIPQGQLAEIIFQDSVQFDNQHIALTYFANYFAMPGANVDHPVLGNLNDFADAADAQWANLAIVTNEPLGPNLVFNFIKSKLLQQGF